MGETLNIRDVDPRTKATLSREASRAGMSLAAYVRMRLDEIAGTPYRKAGALKDELRNIGEPLDGWEAMTGEDLEAWEASDERPSP